MAAARSAMISTELPLSLLFFLGCIPAGIQPKKNSKESGNSVEIIADRAAAIMSAVRKAKPQDIVLVAGKGHETTQEFNGKRFDFSDQVHLRLVSGGAA